MDSFETFPRFVATRIIVAIDIQREYVTPGRPFHLKGIAPALANCARVLTAARAHSWPVAHVRHVQSGHLFNADLPFSRFVEGFEPLPHEMVFTKSNLSCYSDPAFRRLMESAAGDEVYVIGFNTAMCCLSTFVDGFHRGHKLVFVQDAALARATRHADEAEAHRHATDIISIYGRVTDTDTLLQPEAA